MYPPKTNYKSQEDDLCKQLFFKKFLMLPLMYQIIFFFHIKIFLRYDLKYNSACMSDFWYEAKNEQKY